MITRITRFTFLFCLAMSVPELFGQSAGATAPQQEDEFVRKKPETKMSEVITTDSLPASALFTRAVAWVKADSDKYRKTAGTTTGNKIECVASFPVKPKALNPDVDYTGKITMKVLIECRDSRYRYTVSDIRHESKSGRATAGSIDNVVPECGSVAMHDMVWKKLKGEALRDAAMVVSDLKNGMSEDPVEVNEDDW